MPVCKAHFVYPMIGRLFLLLVSVTPARAMYYMDDTNSSIVYNGLPSKWSKLSPTSDAWVNNTEIYNSTL
jgi:hypothetical protein